MDGRLLFRDTATGDGLGSFRGHTHGVCGLAFSPDGGRLASAGMDGTIKLWDTASGQELLTLRGDPFLVHSVAFSPDGRSLASAGADGSIKLWETTAQGAPEQAHAWHRRLAEDCEQAEHWFAAAWHLARPLPFEPGSWQRRAAGGRVCGE